MDGMCVICEHVDTFPCERWKKVVACSVCGALYILAMEDELSPEEIEKLGQELETR